MSHTSQAVLEDMINKLNECYRKITPLMVTWGDPLMVTWGDMHKYLRMTLDYSSPSKVTIGMDAYVKILLEEAPKDMPEYLHDSTSQLYPT